MTVKPVTRVCNACDEEKPLEAFYPSQVKRRGSVRCKACSNDTPMAKYQDFAEKIYAVHGLAPWASVDVAPLLGLNSFGMGRTTLSMLNRGLVEKIKEGVYRLSPDAAPKPDTPTPLKPDAAVMIHRLEAVFLQVGDCVFPSNVMIEHDLRGGVTVTYPVAEFDPKTGISTPREVQFTAEEWAQRRKTTFTEIAGEAPSAREEVARLRADLTAAIELAQQNEEKARQLDDMMRVVSRNGKH